MGDKCTPVTEHGELTKVFDNVYIVQGSCTMSMGIRISRMMTIVVCGDDVTILNSVRVNEEVEEAILKLGTIKNLVRMSGAHGRDDLYFIEKFKPTYWWLEGEEPYDGCPPLDKPLTEDGEGPFPEMKLLKLKNVKVPEVVIWIPDNGGTVLTCDFIQNTLEPSNLASFVGRIISRRMGFVGECRCVPMWVSINGKNHLEDYERMLEWEFENLIPAHGEAKVGNAKAACELNARPVLVKEEAEEEEKE